MKFQILKQALRQTPEGRIIVYCGTRKVTEAVAEELGQSFEGVNRYHAGLTSAERTRVQGDYENGTDRILVATNAFGMGIDHPNVRLVVHFNMPANIDALYQEMGRAGRDGAPSTCVMLYSPKDKGLQSFFITSSEAPAEIKRSRWNTLNALVDYAEGGECRHGEILTYYQDSQRISSCGHCDNCAPASERKVQRPVNVAPILTSAARLRKSKRAPQVFDEPWNDQAQMRFELLRDWRKAKALELDVPAFVIFGDKTIRQIASKNPQALSELAGIYGLGEVKLERFGPELLKVLAALV